jgi:hypothetical protein
MPSPSSIRLLRPLRTIEQVVGEHVGADYCDADVQDFNSIFSKFNVLGGSLKNTLSVQLSTHLDAVLLHLEDARDRLTESQRLGETDSKREALLALELVQRLSVQFGEQIAQRSGSGSIKSKELRPTPSFARPTHGRPVLPNQAHRSISATAGASARVMQTHQVV